MNEAQRDELSALEAVYPDELKVVKPHQTYSIQLEESGNSLTLYFEFHADYPVAMPPRFQLESFLLDEVSKAELRNELLEKFEEDSGVLFAWVEHINEFLSRLPPIPVVNTEPVKLQVENSVPHEPVVAPAPVSALGDTSRELEIFHGEPLTDRKSVFQSHVCRVSSVGEVEQMLTLLKSNKKIAQATHNILAYRFTARDRGVLVQDCEDDKEYGAGARLSHLLQFSGAQDVAVVVTRWYGGVHLGPDRFKHINNVARTLLVECGFIQVADKGSAGKRKKK